MDNTSSKPPQISEMFQKFAIEFKTKTIEFFTKEDIAASTAATTDNKDSMADGFSLFDSAEDFITDQTKPNPLPNSSTVVRRQI